MLALSVGDLVAAEEAVGSNLDFLFFWGHQPPKSGIERSCLSQWWPADFTVGGDSYRTAEHYMMAEKAALFDDHQLRRAILATDDPAEAKALGRKVQGFDESRWADCREEVVVRGNLAKFRQNRELADFLLGTAGKVLVEASPYDRIWGIGLRESDERARRPSSWQGLNLLGFALMDVRAQLSRIRLTS